MEVKLIAHTQLSNEFINQLISELEYLPFSSGQATALTAIRTCYSANKPSEILALEYEKYFGQRAKDGKEGTEADRLIRHIMNSGHTSTLEHISFTFALEGVSRSLLAQLTRHRHLSFSVQSQRYVKFGSDDKSGGMDYVVPPSISEDKLTRGVGGVPIYADEVFNEAMERAQEYYDLLRKVGVPAEDARMVLPNAASTNIIMTGNLRTFLEFYSKRGEGTHAQWEIKDLAEKVKQEVTKVEKWTKPFFVTEK